jgi:hypothetical protein
VPSAYAAPKVTSLLLSPRATEVILEGERVSAREALAAEHSGTFSASFELKKRITIHVPLGSRTIHRPYNVVAIIRGADPKLRDEVITIEAHLDGAVGAREIDGDVFYNSADDNASGSAASLAIAEAWPRRHGRSARWCSSGTAVRSRGFGGRAGSCINRRSRSHRLPHT